MEITIENIFQQPFVIALEKAGFPVFAVGGCVRDFFMNKDSKDVDIVVEKVSIEELEFILGLYGKVDLVGKSFGVIKFKPKDFEDVIDIAVPRKDKLEAGATGHKGITAEFNPSVTLQDDLKRRDFTMNSIAIDSRRQLIDPFGGQEDIKNKIVKQTDPTAFSEDPLRMVRAVQFAARFNFTIEKETLANIIASSERIKEISGERILIELEKIAKARGFVTAWKLFEQTQLIEKMFRVKLEKAPYELFFINSLTEFLFLLLPAEQQSTYYLQVLKGDKLVARDLQLLQKGSVNIVDKVALCEFISICHSTAKYLLSSHLMADSVTDNYNRILSKKLPLSIRDLDVTSQELMSLGFSGPALGGLQKGLLYNCMQEELLNTKKDLLSYAECFKSFKSKI